MRTSTKLAFFSASALATALYQRVAFAVPSTNQQPTGHKIQQNVTLDELLPNTNQQPTGRKILQKATLDTLLMVTAQSRFIDIERQPKREQLCAELLAKTINPADQQTFQRLASGGFETLKDFIVFRAALPPTQTLEEILSLLNFTEFHGIHRSHLLTNLIYAHSHGEISIYELGTILQNYSYLEFIRRFVDYEYKDETMRQQVANGVSVSNKPVICDKQLNPEIIPYFWNNSPVHENDLGTFTFTPSKHAQLNNLVIFEMNVSTPRATYEFMQEVDELYKHLGHGYAMIPLHILLQLHIQAKDLLTSCMLPLPVIGCFDLTMLQQAECDIDTMISFRPITLPSFLDPRLKALFTGADPSANRKDVHYDRYHADAIMPGFKDMTRAHGMHSTTYGVLNHDLWHVMMMNSRFSRLNLSLFAGLIDSISMLEATAKSADKNYYTDAKEDILDSGYQNWLREILCRTGSTKEYIYPNLYGAQGLRLWSEIIRALPSDIKQLLMGTLKYEFNHTHWKGHGVSTDFQSWFTDAFGEPFEPNSVESPKLKPSGL